MAILRDAKTGQGVAAGTPVEMVVLADEIGRENIIFDDVGEKFDPDVVKKKYEEEYAGLIAVVDDPGEHLTPKQQDEVKKDAQNAADTISKQLEVLPEDVSQAQEALEQAHRQAENPV